MTSYNKMYRQLLKTSLAHYELTERSRNSPKGLKFCNGLCQDFRAESKFTFHKNLCRECRNILGLGKKQIDDNKITIDQFKENPQLVNGLDAVIETKQECKTCKQERPVSDFEPKRRICKACRSIQTINRNNKDLDTHIADIEKLKNNINELKTFINHIPKDKLILLISHFEVGRKSTDNKEQMVSKMVEHFKKLASPNICLGGCGSILEQQFSTCKKCERIEDKKVSTSHINNLEFENNIEKFVSTLEILKKEEDIYNKKQIVMIAKQLGLDPKQIAKKQEVITMINAELTKRKEDKAKLLQIVVKKPEIELNGIMVLSRLEDGYINATQLCKAGKKFFKDWKRLESTKELIQALENDIKKNTLDNISNGQDHPLKLIDVKVGGNHSGSWIHPDLAVQLAQWISPVFALQVSRWIRELAMTGKVSLGNEKSGDELLKLQQEILSKNKEIKILEMKHIKLLKKRNYHKFKQGPAFYIISDSDGKSQKYKVGIDLVDVNIRLQQHRSTTPAIKLEYLLYSNKAGLIEEAMLELYKEKKNVYLNHEWIYDIDIKHIVGNVDTLVKFLGVNYTVDENIEEYNKNIFEVDE